MTNKAMKLLLKKHLTVLKLFIPCILNHYFHLKYQINALTICDNIIYITPISKHILLFQLMHTIIKS